MIESRSLPVRRRKRTGSQGPGHALSRAAATRLRLRYVLAVWGERYIDRYFDFAFPTHISPGNLPALARDHELSFTILTRRQDRARFEGHPRFAALRALGPVGFVEIDDLISHPGVFTVTLTLAFTRAMRAAGPAAIDTSFIFMNADFLLADGTLRTAARRLLGGAQAVLTASPRTVAEELGPRIATLPRDASGALTLPPRQAVAMALSAPHAMVLAKQPRLGLMHTEVPNQYFWLHDAGTLLARSFIMFMLAVRPNRTGYRATAYCDYAMVSDLTSPYALSVIDDSDDGFILELQSRTQELDLVRLGPLTEATATDRLASWTTQHHRDLARLDLVFHAGELPESLAETRAEAARFIGGVLAGLPPPVPPHNHPHWTSGLAAWRFHRPGVPLPEEVAPLQPPRRGGRELAAGVSGEVSAGEPEVEMVPARPVGWLARRLYSASLPLRHWLMSEPVEGDLTAPLAPLVDAAGTREIAIIGEAIAQLDLGHRRICALPVSVLEAEALANTLIELRQCALVVVALGDDELDRLPAAFALASGTRAVGGTAAVVVARRALSPAALDQRLIAELTRCHPLDLALARATIGDSRALGWRRRRFQRALWRLRAAPTLPRLARTGIDMLPLVTLQLSRQWAPRLAWRRDGSAVSGIVIAFDPK